MRTPTKNATVGANTGGGVRATRELPEKQGRKLSHLYVELDTGCDLICERLVEPVGHATVAEIMAAIQDEHNNGGFSEPLVQHGEVKAIRAGKRVVVATFSTDYDWWAVEIESVTAHFKDGSEEETGDRLGLVA